MRFHSTRGMFQLDQVPATWFPRHRDPPPDVAREGSRKGAFARFGFGSAAAHEAVEAASGLLQGPLDLEELGRDLVLMRPAELLGEAGDAPRELVERGGQWR